MGDSFWHKNSTVTHILFELCLLWYLAQGQILASSTVSFASVAFVFTHSTNHSTEVRYVSFLSGGFITAIVVNPPERKLENRTSVHSSPHWYKDNNHMHKWKTCCRWTNEDARGWVSEWNTSICLILGIFENIFVSNLRLWPFLFAFPDCQFFSYDAQTLHCFTVC